MTDTTKPEVEFWTLDESCELLTTEDLDQAIEEELSTDVAGWEDTVTVYGFARRVVSKEWAKSLAESVAERILEDLDEEFAGGDDDPLNGITDILPLAEKFVADVVEEYEVWQCARVCTETVNLAEWIQRAAPHWMEENPDIKAWVEARLPKEAAQ